MSTPINTVTISQRVALNISTKVTVVNIERNSPRHTHFVCIPWDQDVWHVSEVSHKCFTTLS